ncbi:MAG: M20/M25/M40 family metallo-hydrolase [Bacteroidota bacterium]
MSVYSRISFLILLSLSVLFADGKVHHKISVTLDPAKHTLSAVDQITLPAAVRKGEITFILNSALKVSSGSPNYVVALKKKNVKADDVGIDREEYDSTVGLQQNSYSITLKNKKNTDSTVILKFSGPINYVIKQAGEEYARGFSQTPGIIDEKGIYLAGSTQWIPSFNDELITFELTVNLPEQWKSVSQGKRTVNEVKNGTRVSVWNSPEPMEEIYLIAAKFTEYSRSAGAVDVQAFLRTPDEALANKYLEATEQYLEMYRKLVGPYPFTKFALVENFWETGYGMPSFTLLGEQIIRFPFILNSSYPHELLHNYWGNSVYVDAKSGNWCEGLTAYLADHLIAEQRGQAEDYRRATLQKYTDYVTPQNDFPLNKFRSRYSGPSEAIGYGKTSLVWNMLRDDVGDEAFIRAIQKFYRENKYRNASFSDIRAAFEATTGKDLKPFFAQWVDRIGAPELELTNVTIKKDSLGHHLAFSLKQVQKEDPFQLTVPVAVTFEKRAEIKRVTLNGREQRYDFIFADEPRKVQADPQFSIFRRLDSHEIPPSLTKILGAQEIVIVLPSNASAEHLESYKDFATRWSGDATKKISTVWDTTVSMLAAGKSYWILGTENRLTSVINSALNGYGSYITNDSIRLDQTVFKGANHSFVITVQHPQDPSSGVAFISSFGKDAIPGLARKVPHYGKYSYLVFEGNEPANIAKGEWASVGSPLDVTLRASSIVPLAKRKALATLDPVFSSERLKKSVDYLASEELAGRAPGSPGIAKAAEFIVKNFAAAGLLPGADDSTYFQRWSETVDSVGTKAEVKNIIGIIPGTNPDLKDQSVVITAHYDHLGLGWPGVNKGNEGKIHYGADDNASGVSVLLELAQTLGRSLKPQRTIVFVALASEETGLLGSKYYVKNNKRFPAKKAIGVLNFDAVGRLGSNKVSVLSASSAREWRFIFLGASYVTGVESEIITQELDASDQRSFIEAGIPGVQFFSGANGDYHRPSDTPDKIDIAGLMKVAALGREGLLYLGDRIEPLTFQGNTVAASTRPQGTGERKVSTGMMPDFAFTGEGVKIADLAPDSPAAKAGAQKGDVIIQFGNVVVKDLRAYSDALKKQKPGDIVDIVLQRNGKEVKTKIELIEK